MADCKTCKERRSATEPIPYIAHESAMARMERTIKRLWILLIVVVTLLVASNGAWLWYESQFEEVTTISIHQASETTGISRDSISKCCRGVFKQAGGFVWEYTK